MSDTLLRHWMTLRLVPRAPRKTTVEEIRSGLAEQDYEVSKRTVERDLNELSLAFPLHADTRNRPYGWQWHKDASQLDIPSLELPTALTFHFVNLYLSEILPVSVREHLGAHFETARKVLNAQASKRLPRWSEKVLFIPPGQPLQAPEIRPGVMDTVYEAVLHDRKLRVDYRPRVAGGAVREYELNPLGLVWRSRVCYLVATAYDYTDILQFSLHRIDAADTLDKKSRTPKGFSLKVYVEQGAFAYPVGDPVRLRARFTRGAAYHLHETPLGEDQKIKELDEEWVRVSATVQDTSQLRWWLLGFGDQVVVEAPVALKREFADVVGNLAVLYAEDK